MTTDLRELFLEADMLPVGPPPTEKVLTAGRRRTRFARTARVAAAGVLVAAAVSTTFVVVDNMRDHSTDNPAYGRRYTMGELQRAALAVFRGIPGMPDPRVVAYVEVPAGRERLIVVAGPGVTLKQLQALTNVPITKVGLGKLAQAFDISTPGPGLQKPVRVARGGGKVAYVDGVLLDAISGGDVANPAEALAYQKEMDAATWERRMIPVATKDGSKILGSFPIGRSSQVVVNPKSVGTVTGKLVFAGGLNGTTLPPPKHGLVVLVGGGATYKASADARGDFEIDARPGTYTATATSPSYRINGEKGTCTSGSPVRVTESSTTTITIACQIK